MPKKRTVTFAVSAFDDLEDILVWYRNQEVPGIGQKLVGEIISQVERLAVYPESGRIVPEFEIPHLRETIYPPYRIVYRLDGSKVKIVRIWRSERLLKMPE